MIERLVLRTPAALLILAGSAHIAVAGAFPPAMDGDQGFTILGADPNESSGQSVSSAGDVNGDGFDDVIVGAPYADANGNNDSGACYIVFGDSALNAGGTVSSASLNGADGFVINGIDADDRAGWSVAAAGDVNGDGYDDVIIGAPYADANSNGDSGECYLVFGSASVGAGGSLNLSALNGANGFVINGIDALDETGFSVSGAGDVNDDGFDDVIIGAPEASPGVGVSRAGRSYVVYGGANVGAGGSLNLSALNSVNGVVLNGNAAYDRSGRAVSSAGDMNGDGFDDLIVGAPFATPYGGNNFAGQSYVVFGGTIVGVGGSLNLGSLNGGDGFAVDGVDLGDRIGMAVSDAGDVNGDGFADVIVGAPFATPTGGNSFAGESYVIFGAVGVGFSGKVSLGGLNGANGFVIKGIDTQDASGRSVSAAGDVNDDGFDDIIIGAALADSSGADAGEGYVVFGGTGVGASGSLSLSTLNGMNGFVVSGVTASDQCGYSVSAAGDVNGDGVDDLIIGAPFADPDANADAGETYIILGMSDAPPDCPGDATGDGLVDINDLNLVLGNFGSMGTPGIPGDATDDGNVDINDLNLVIGNFGTNCN